MGSYLRDKAIKSGSHVCSDHGVVRMDQEWKQKKDYESIDEAI